MFEKVHAHSQNRELHISQQEYSHGISFVELQGLLLFAPTLY
jgi:hypothetical protein